MYGGYITPQGVSNLGLYAYSGVDNSLVVAYVLKHFWNWLIEFFPMWMAPNVLTLTGLMCVLSSFLIVLYNCSEIVGCELPFLSYWVIAFLIFAYQTLDNLDGKQARRTGASSALGEVFDHGGDCLTVPMFVIILATVFQFDPLSAFVSLFAISTMFNNCHWESYFTGTVVLDVIFNPTEAQLAIMALLIYTSFGGSAMWLKEVNTVIFGQMQLNHVVLLVCCIGALIGNYNQFNKIKRVSQSKGTPIRNVLLFNVPFLLVYVIATLWVIQSPSVLNNNPRLFLFTFGWFASYISIRQMIHSVCKEQFKLYYNLITVGFVAVLIAVISENFIPIVSEDFVLQGLCAIIVFNVGWMATSLIKEFCHHLDIWAFSIKPKVPSSPAIDDQI